jgi:hypothetical protein
MMQGRDWLKRQLVVMGIIGIRRAGAKHTCCHLKCVAAKLRLVAILIARVSQAEAEAIAAVLQVILRAEAEEVESGIACELN